MAAQTTLRQAAAAWGIPVGAAASDGEYGPSNDWLLVPAYANLLSTQYSMLEPGNAMKWDVTQPTIDTYNFAPGDTLVEFAQQYGMRVRGHNLCWHTQFPQWLAPYASASTTTPADMATLLQNHINAEVTHFAGKVFAWDVVNEAFSDSTPTTLGNSIWYNQPGIGIGTLSGAATDTGYIEQAFRWAHAADPNALLFYNDYGIEGPGNKFNAVLAMVTDFVKRGVPINGVGFEMHLDLGGQPTPAGLTQNMQALAKLGIQVHITEMDVRLLLDKNGNPSNADLQSQATVYQNILTVCLQQPNCTAFQVWGVSYNDSWIPGFKAGYGAALPFDASYAPTPAFNGLINAFQNTPPVLHQNSIVNAAGYEDEAVAPGELLSIYNTSFGPASAMTGQADASGNFPTNLGGAQVLFDGTPAPLLYAGPGQVNTIVPFEVAGQQQTVLQYQYNSGGGVVSNTLTLPVANAAPAIFSQNQSGSGPGAIENQDYSINSASNPAAAGTYIQIFGTGGGVVTPAATDGALAPDEPVNLATWPTWPTATIGGMPASVYYAGSAPALVNGVLQVDLQIPTGLTPGPQPVVITIGLAQSQPGLTVAVK